MPKDERTAVVQGYGFVVNTESFAGAFERDVVAHMTGCYGECGVGKEIASKARREFKASPEGRRFRRWCRKHVENKPDDHGCNPRPPLSEEEQSRFKAWRESLPVGPPLSAEERAILDERSKGPTFSSGVMTALLARRKEMAKQIAADTMPLREAAVAAHESNLELSDLLTGAADAIHDLRRRAKKAEAIASAERALRVAAAGIDACRPGDGLCQEHEDSEREQSALGAYMAAETALRALGVEP
jgi:hypothetical protein